ncbi:hypothetical protein FY048_04870 [Acinetobacter sp. 1124_18A]|jgi:hypothetical protein|uniref:hypothetical protein n=1 Tax=Acinetobacter sp. 1124_18A TaxID=2605958 RepID=UPI0040581F90
MFIQHDEYIINTDQINYLKIGTNETSLTIFFEGKSKEGGAGFNLKLNFEDEQELSDFVEKLLK